jgi:hypothetical protein
VGGTDINRLAASTGNRREAAAQINAFRSALDAIRMDRNLSGEGKRREIAIAYVSTKTRLANLAKQEQSTTSVNRDELQRQLFADGLNSQDPAAVVSRRDALDRADRIETVSQAEQMLDRANTTQDSALASAIARTAAARLSNAEPAWADVLRTYAASRPAAAQALAQLAQLDRDRAADRIASQAAYGLSRPTELAGESEASIAVIAAQPDSAPAASGFLDPAWFRIERE